MSESFSVEFQISTVARQLAEIKKEIDSKMLPEFQSEIKAILEQAINNPHDYSVIHDRAERKFSSWLARSYPDLYERQAQLISDLERLRLQIIEKESTRCASQATQELDYYAYLKSPEWRKRANVAKRRAGHRCQLCNRHKDEIQLDTHHRTYERLGNEKSTDLIVLCRDCHEKFHDKLGR